jgi:hypothetical protein
MHTDILLIVIIKTNVFHKERYLKVDKVSLVSFKNFFLPSKIESRDVNTEPGETVSIMC